LLLWCPGSSRISLAGLSYLFGSRPTSQPLPAPSITAATPGDAVSIDDSVHVYMPTAPFYRVISVDMESGRPMQSAAKCPFLLTFNVSPFAGPDSIVKRLNKAQALKRKQVACRSLRWLGYLWIFFLPALPFVPNPMAYAGDPCVAGGRGRGGWGGE
jgi:hypothetical protein